MKPVAFFLATFSLLIGHCLMSTELFATNPHLAAPKGLVVVPGNHHVRLFWLPVTEDFHASPSYVVELSPSLSGEWRTVQQLLPTNSGCIVDGLDNGRAYDFRVSSVSNGERSLPSEIVSGTPTVSRYLHVLSTGQSLALGFNAFPILSTSQPYHNLSLSSNFLGVDPPFIDLQEINGHESPSSGLANSLHVLDSASGTVVIGMHASSGAPYLDLKKGTGPWLQAMTQVTRTNQTAHALDSNATYFPVGVTVVHGEADNNAGRAAFYQGYLEEWQRDYEHDIDSILGSPVGIPLFVSQMNTGWSGEMAVAQLNAHKANPGKIILVGPKYQYRYFDGLHLNNNESKHLGEMLAKVINEVSLKGYTWNPLMPTAVNRNGNVIVVQYHIPFGTLDIDTTSVAKRPHLGFEFVQTGGNNVSIVDVALINNASQVQITLSGIPTGSNQLLRYAYTCYAGGTGFPACGNAADSMNVGGNIRDMDSTVSQAIGSTGMPLYNWSVAFEEPVSGPMAIESPSVNQLFVFPNPAHRELKVAVGEGASMVRDLMLRDLSGKAIQFWDNKTGKSTIVLGIGEIAAGFYMLSIRMENGAEYVRKVEIR